jgi:formylmethanofuran dehydrogenase subunit E
MVTMTSREKKTDGWRCPDCGEYYVWHGLSKHGRPICPEREEESRGYGERKDENNG